MLSWWTREILLCDITINTRTWPEVALENKQDMLNHQHAIVDWRGMHLISSSVQIKTSYNRIVNVIIKIVDFPFLESLQEDVRVTYTTEGGKTFF